MRFAGILLAASLALIFTACSGTTSRTNNPTPNPALPTTPTPAPAPPPGGGGSGGGSSPAQYTESMENYTTSAVSGQVVIAQNGSGTMAISGATPSSAFGIEFCPFADPNAACDVVGTASSNSSGNISASFTMHSGGYAGIFELLSGTTIAYESAFNVPAAGSTLQAPLIRASTVGAGFGGLTGQGFGVGTDPLKIGSVTLGTGTSVHIALTGAVPNKQYGITWCRNNVGSSCFAIGLLTTDATGSFSGDFDLTQSSLGTGTLEAGAFYLGSEEPAAMQFVQGFTVP